MVYVVEYHSWHVDGLYRCVDRADRLAGHIPWDSFKSIDARQY